MVAYFMPSTVASMPNIALPSTLPGRSRRGLLWPMMVNSSGVFSRGEAGGVYPAARVAKCA